jgi:hypothetical protein
MTRETIRRIVVGVCAVVAGAALWASPRAAAGQAGAGGDTHEKTAGEQFKNVQVLKDMPAAKLRDAMEYMSASLGVECAYCHVNPFDSDQKATKKAARKMLEMTAAINRDNFGGDMEVSCYTCHRGAVHPGSSVSLDAPHPEAHGGPDAAPADGLPTLDEVYDRYVAALGGKAALDKITSRVTKGEQVGATSGTATIESYAKAPGKLLSVTKMGEPANVTFTVGIGGDRPWRRLERANGQTQVGPARAMELAEVTRSAELFAAVHLKGAYKNAAVAGKESVDGHEAFVVRATSPDGFRERFYFDVKTGLLVRRDVGYTTYLGELPFRVEYDDYRKVDGVMEPFKVRWTTPEGGWTETYTEVKHNVAVDDARFEMPQPPPPAPAH